jgi:type 1 glutamine amidotransferase
MTSRGNTTRRGGALVVFLLAFVACADSSGTESPPAPTPEGGNPPALKHVLVVTHTTGFRHDSIPTAESTLSVIAAASGTFDVAFCRNAADVARTLTPAALANVDAVVFASTTGNLGIPDLPAFLDWIRGGRGFVGVHSATDTYHDAPAYLAMIGGEFATHGDQATADLRVETTTHPATSGLPNPWRVHDELYEFVVNPRSSSTILLSLDRHPPDGHPGAGQPGDFPLAWSRAFGSGRVFYTALGHRDDVWTNATFRGHLRGAIEWAAGVR